MPQRPAQGAFVDMENASEESTAQRGFFGRHHPSQLRSPWVIVEPGWQLMLDVVTNDVAAA